MDDKIWQMFWDLNEKYHKNREEIIQIKTAGNTEDNIQDDYNSDKKWIIATIIMIIGSVGFLFAYMIVNHII